jgi:nucleoside-diphosphate-sugar epimerase
MKKVVIFGCGYIGNILIRQYLAKGYEVRGVDNFFRDIGDSLLPIISNPDFEFVRGDITNYQDCVKNIEGADQIVLLSGLVGAPICDRYPSLTQAVNVQGAKNVVDARNSINDQIPLFCASTGSVLGKIEEICTENTKPNPLSLYGRSKLEAEQYILSFPKTVAHRFATAFGLSPMMRVDLLVNDLTMQAVNNRCLVIFQADAHRTFIHVQDFARSIIFSLENINQLKYNLYNAGSNTLNYTKREIAEMIAKKTGCYVHFAEIGSDPDARDYIVDYSRLENEGFKCEKTLEFGIDEIIKANPLLQVKNKYE